MLFDKHLMERIDACRPGSADKFDPSLGDAGFPDLASQLADDPRAAERYGRVQELDARLKSALANVASPTGLEAAILARLAAASAEELTLAGGLCPAAGTAVEAASETSVPVTATASPASVPSAALSAHDTRRRWLALLATAASLAVVAGTIWLWPAQQPFGMEEFDQAVRRFYEAEPGGESFLLADQAPPAAFPASRLVLGADGPHTAWRRVAGLLGRSGVAYELTGPEGVAATLYVLPLKGSRRDPALAPLLATQPPERPFFTAGLVTAAWREGALAYALVIRGSERTYRRLIAPPSAVAQGRLRRRAAA